MRVLVCYDVRTSGESGVGRLRRVARVCVNHGQRVQKSVFECVLTAAQLESMRAKLLAVLDPSEDNLRIYRVSERYGTSCETYGLTPDIDFEGPLVA